MLSYNLVGFMWSTLEISAKTPKCIYVILRRHSQLSVENYVTQKNMLQYASIICDMNGCTTTMRGRGIVTSHMHLLFPVSSTRRTSSPPPMRTPTQKFLLFCSALLDASDTFPNILCPMSWRIHFLPTIQIMPTLRVWNYINCTYFSLEMLRYRPKHPETCC